MPNKVAIDGQIDETSMSLKVAVASRRQSQVPMAERGGGPAIGSVCWFLDMMAVANRVGVWQNLVFSGDAPLTLHCKKGFVG